MGKEPVYDGDRCVGYVTSAAYGYTIGTGIAYAWLPAELDRGGTDAADRLLRPAGRRRGRRGAAVRPRDGAAARLGRRHRPAATLFAPHPPTHRCSPEAGHRDALNVNASVPLDLPLAEVDPEVAAAIAAELHRQQSTLEMIASENFAPVAVMEAQGSVLTNKYAEGYPGRRYYGGCEHVDVIEQLAIDRVKALFGAEFANVQPHSGAQANAAALFALLQPGDTILGLDLAHGGHLTHGMKINFSGKLYNVVAYHVRESDGLVDMDEVERLAREHRPKLIIAGWSAYPRQLDFAAFRRDRRRGRRLPDGRHGALRRAGRGRAAPVAGAARARRHHHHPQDARRPARRRDPHQRPGPRQEDQLGGLPRPAGRPAGARHRGQGGRVQDRGGPRSSRSARRARWRARGSSPSGCSSPTPPRPASRVLTGGTDVHLVLVDLRDSELDGQQAEDRLHEIGITVNRNAVPFDPRPPMVTSGLRIGTPALATRGFDADGLPRGRRHHRRGAAARRSTTTTRAGLRGPGGRPRRQAPALPHPRTAAVTAASSTDPTAQDAGSRPARAPRLPLAQPRAEAHLRRGHRRRRRPRPGHRLLPGQEPRHHQRRGAGEGLAGGRQHGPQHHDHPVQLPVGRERGHLRARAEAVGGAGRRSSTTRSCSASAACSTSRTACRTSARACAASTPTGSTASTPSGSTPEQVKEVCPIVNVSPGRALPGARAPPTSRGPASPSTTTSPGASPAAADALGVDLIQDCEVTGIDMAGGRVTGVRDHPGPHRGRPGRAVRGRATPRCWPRWPGCGCRCRATRCRRWSPSCSSRCTRPWSCPTRVHVYVSQAHKGELVMGAGIDAYNGYGQRGAFHIIERQMAAALELFPDLRPGARAADLGRHRGRHPRRLADRRAHARRGPVRQLRLGHRRLQGHPGRRLVLRPHDRQRRAAPAQRRRSPSTGSPPARSSTSTAPPPWPTDAAGATRCC